MSAEKITMIMQVPTNVVDQSLLAQETAEISGGKLPLSEMMRAKKEVDGLLPLPSDLYAPKPIKVNDAHLTPAEKAHASANVVDYGDVQKFISERNRAEKAVAAIRHVYTFTAMAKAARAEKLKVAKAS